MGFAVVEGPKIGIFSKRVTLRTCRIWERVAVKANLFLRMATRT